MKRGILMWDKRSDPYHFRIQFFQEKKIICKIFHSLIRSSYHKSRTCLKAQFFQCSDPSAVFQALKKAEHAAQHPSGKVASQPPPRALAVRRVQLLAQ